MTLCQKLTLVIKIIGSVISLAALIGQILYLRKSEFASKMLFISFEAVIVLRLLMHLLVGAFLAIRNLCKHQVEIPTIDNRVSYEEMEFLYAKRKKICCQGCMLYLFLPLMMYTGFYRVYKVRDFSRILIVSYTIELFFSLVPLVFIQSSTNINLNVEYLSPLQQYALALTILAIIDIVLEAGFMIREMRGLRVLR